MIANPDVINPATGLKPGDYGGTALATESFNAASAGSGIQQLNTASTELATTVSTQATAISSAFPSLTESVKKAASSVTTISENAQTVPQGLEKFNQILGGVTQIIGGIGMALSGFQQIKKGGASNILGGIGSILLGIGGGIMGFKGLFRAEGGPIAARKPYIVGEQGPELIVPGRSGMVVNNDKLREAMAGRGGGAGSGGMTLDMKFETVNFGGEEFVSRSQLEQAMYETRRAAAREGARQGESRTISRIQQDPRTRRRLGI
jgi:hypothetical protein